MKLLLPILLIAFSSVHAASQEDYTDMEHRSGRVSTVTCVTERTDININDYVIWSDVHLRFQKPLKRTMSLQNFPYINGVIVAYAAGYSSIPAVSTLSYRTNK